VPGHGAGFWALVTILVLVAAWGAWRLSAPARWQHPSIITDVGRG